MASFVDYSDQANIFNPNEFTWPVYLIGCGGIGSVVSQTLLKMGVQEIHLYDDDVLEARNMLAEVSYSVYSVDFPKVEAVVETAEFLCGSYQRLQDGVKITGLADYNEVILKSGQKIFIHEERVNADTKLDGVVISGVDSMKSRKEIWEAVKNCLDAVPLYIDGRIGGESYQVLSLLPTDFEAVETYEGWLVDESEVAPLECGARATAYIAMMIAGEIARDITLFHRNLPVEIRLPQDLRPKNTEKGE